MDQHDYSNSDVFVRVGAALLCIVGFTTFVSSFFKKPRRIPFHNDSHHISKPLNVGIVGAGAIGTFAGMRILESNLISNVILFGRESLMKSLEKTQNVITLKDNTKGGEKKHFLVGEKFHVICNGNLESLKNCDVIILSVKSNASQDVGESIAKVLPPNSSATIVSFQNGTRNPETLRAIFGCSQPNVHVVASVVAFAAEWEAGGSTFALNFPGGCIFEKPRANSRAQQHIACLIKALNKGGLQSKQTTRIESIMHAKLLMNLINPINALSGVTIPIMFAQRGYRLVLAAAIEEAALVLKSSGIEAGKSFPVIGIGLFAPFLLRLLPDYAFKVVFEQKFIGESYKSSMLQDVERGRKSTEVEFLCGEIIRLAPSKSSVNTALLKAISESNQRHKFFSADELLSLVNLD